MLLKEIILASITTMLLINTAYAESAAKPGLGAIIAVGAVKKEPDDVTKKKEQLKAKKATASMKKVEPSCLSSDQKCSNKQ